MSNPMRYIKNLEAAGFERIQAEAQVQMVLDALEGDLATKADFAILKADFKSDVAVFKEQVDSRFGRVEGQMREMELRLITRLGLITATSTSIGVALLAWLIKI